MCAKQSYGQCVASRHLVAVLLILSVLFFPSRLCAQTVLMPASGHGDATTSYAEVYDDGGPSGTHSNYCNASYTFHTVNPLGRYRIEVLSMLTHPRGNAMLEIRNGSTTSGTTICTYPYGSGGVFFSSSNSVTILFTADDDMPTDGFKVILCEYANRIPENLHQEFLDSNTFSLQWSQTTPPLTWIIDYAIVPADSTSSMVFSDSANFHTIVTDSTNLVFTDIPVGYHLVYRIYSDYSSLGAPCYRDYVGEGPVYSTPFVCPCLMAFNFQMTELDDSIRVTWTPNPAATSWHVLLSGGSNSLDTIIPGSPAEITFPYIYGCTPGVLSVNGNCSDVFCNMSYLSLPTRGCMGSVGGLQLVATTGHSVSLRWSDYQEGSRYVLLYRRADNPSASLVVVDTFAYGTRACEVVGLQPHTSYYFEMRLICPDGSVGCYRSNATFQTTLDNCIDFINFNSDKVRCTYGSYANPYQYAYWSGCRHLPIVDTMAFDANTNNMLRCIPPGEGASFRLGDDNIGAQAESVAFDYDVDSLDKDMIVLKYAVVMQNSNHTAVNQPHFTMEILDSAGAILDTTCCYADFYAAGDMGWNSVPGTNIIWKDWTTVGIDIAPYHGQRIRIRFTTKDCSDGGHYGYAYFTIHCDSKRIDLVNLCDNNDSVRLCAPLGFDYRWTHGDDTTVLSTNYEILVPADSTAYFCHASFIGKPECNFTIHSLAVLPKAHAAFTFTVDTCNQAVTFVNMSRVNIDSAFLPYVHQTLDRVWWNIDGETLYGDTIVRTFDSVAEHQIALFCHLSGSLCWDSVAVTLTTDFVHRSPILGDTSACVGDTLLLVYYPQDYANIRFTWDNASHSSERYIVASSDTSVYLVSKYFSCIDTVRHSIAIHPLFDDTLAIDACPGMLDTLGFQVSQSGLYTHNGSSTFGCDSLFTLHLTVHPSFYDTLRVTTCDESYADSLFNVDTTGFYTQPFVSQWGCDSIYHLDFVRFPLWRDTIVYEMLYGNTYVGNGFEETQSGFYENVYVDVNGCDSVKNLDLTVILLRFPNAVTPNGDGINERLAIVNLLEATIFDYTCLWIYDRWGRLIYKKEYINQESDFWDPNATNTPDGTYFYRFFGRANGQIVEHKSAVEVIR